MYHLIPSRYHNDPVEVLSILEAMARFCTLGMASAAETSGANNVETYGYSLIMQAVTDGMAHLGKQLQTDKGRPAVAPEEDHDGKDTYPRMGRPVAERTGPPARRTAA